MASREELTERVAKIETKVERCQEDISRLLNDSEEFKKEVKEYIDKRGKEVFKICTQEQNEKKHEEEKSSSVIRISRWQLRVGIISAVVAVVLILVFILQLIGVINL